jgi:exosortase
MNHPQPGSALTQAKPFGDSSRTDKSPRWLVWSLPAFVLACWALAIRHLGGEWTLNEQYHYGWLVPLLTLYLVKVRFEQCPAPGPSPPPSRIRVILLLLALGSVFAMPLREANMDWRSMGWWLSGLAAAATLLAFWQAGAARWLRHFAFPILFFFTAVPVFRQIEVPGMQWLMQHNAQLSVEVLHWLGLEGQARGNLIALPNCMLGIDEACSGIRSLQGTLMLTLFLGELLGMTVSRRILLLAAGASWAFVTNVGRTVLLALVATREGLPGVEHWHDTAGFTVLGICTAGVSLTAWLLHRRSARRPQFNTALAIDLAAIAQHLRQAALPSAAGLVMLVAGLAFTEFWFRLHERSVTPLTSWHFCLPSELPTFRDTEIAPRVRTELRFDVGYGGQWQDAAGHRWQALYFQWQPGRNAVQTVAVHDPRACLAATGLEEIATLAPVVFERESIRLSFDSYRFRDGAQDVFVFNCLAEDVHRGKSQNHVREDNSIASRFAAAFAGKRHLGQRRLEVAVWAGPGAAAAQTLFRDLLNSNLAVEETAPPR